MKCGNSTEVVHKDVVIIGNGPSGIALSYMLDGNVPYVTSNAHPDEFLSARLAPVVDESLLDQDLGHLASGLEGRTTNPVSLLLDSLIHPYADIGFELESLVEWRKDGDKIDHVVLGKGPPGGSWHSMDPQILTLSLGSWMALPGLKYKARDGSEKRASAKNVAEYYENYVNEMGLQDNFRNNIVVTSVKPLVDERKWVEKVNGDICQRARFCSRPEPKERELSRSKSCTLTNALNYIWSRGQGKLDRCYKRARENKHDASPERKILELSYEGRIVKDRSISLSCEYECENSPRVPSKFCDEAAAAKWVVEAYDMKTRRYLTYTCDNLVLANGSSDLPNRLQLANYKSDPFWLLHDLRSLEIELDLHLQDDEECDPVLIVGAGLSAADAIIATRGRNVPVVHVFRNSAANISKQLPENMYPEYHKVHQMMKHGSSYPLYTALPEYSLTHIDETTHTVTLTSKEGKRMDLKVSYAAVLIGSRPDLGFLPQGYNLGAKKHSPIDCKKNTIHINKLTHSVIGQENLYAVGPLAGDNFVRFLPGGALAVLSDLHKKRYGI